MSEALYDVIGGSTRKVKKQYLVLDGVTRKIKKSYQVVDGVARLFYFADAFTYTGNFAQSQVTIGGVLHNLYTIKGSGTLTLAEDAKYWMCGGGGAGATARVDAVGQGSPGDGGGGGFVKSGTLAAGSHTITVGAAKGATKIGSLSADPGGSATTAYPYKAGDGGSGGGGRARPQSQTSNVPGGTGAGTSTYPFGLTDLKAHCAGGGGGSNYYSIKQVGNGGTGGTNGGNGGEGKYSAGREYGSYYAAGGAYGGGNGGKVTHGAPATIGAASSASFYGGGGGGGSCESSAIDGAESPRYTKGGNGYQGVVYIAIPA